MIPSFALKPEHPRAVALVSEVDGVFVVEPMRFVTLGEAKREAFYLRSHLENSPDVRGSKA